MRMLSVALWILSAFDLGHGRDLEADEREGVENRKAHRDSIQTWLETVTSMDDLLELLYPDYSLVHHCLQKVLQGAPPSSSLKKAPVRMSRETANPKNQNFIKDIMTELQRTACHPREECVEVAKEHPKSTSSFFHPRCVSLHRCGGCCNHEGQDCVSTGQNLVQKTLVQFSPLERNSSIILLTFANHTSCDCQPKQSLHTIRRRAITAYFSQCSPPDVPCSPEMVWDPTYCKCVSKNSSPLSAKELELLDTALLSLCGPNKVLNREKCKCMCQNGLTEASCGPGGVLNQTSCQCVCKQQPSPGVCPPNRTWDPERCGCICRTDCPAGLPRDPRTCQCQCGDGPKTCRLLGKMFNRETCSCYRPPFRISPEPSRLPQLTGRRPQTRTSGREGWRLSQNRQDGFGLPGKRR